jgi:hypothetical protein
MPVRLRRVSLLAVVFVGALAGCHHRAPGFSLAQLVLLPVELETSPAPESLPEIETLPEPEPPPLSPVSPPKVVARRRTATTPAAKDEGQPPAQVASEAEPAALAIGALTTGGDDAPQSQQEAQDLIASILKRIAALPAKTAAAQRRQIAQVRHFLDNAQKALDSGDAEGANNLATKAKLLMDELEKK